MNNKWLLLIGLFLLPSPVVVSGGVSQPVRSAIVNSPSIKQLIPDPDCDRVKQSSTVTVYAAKNGKGPLGSGSVVANLSDGTSLILTNNHVVERADESLHVMFLDGKKIPGRVIATRGEQSGDMGVIQVQGILPLVQFSSQAPASGEPVISIGSPYGKPGVTTSGKVLQPRGNGDIQHKAPIKPGNSGGPLLNSSCQFVGLNKAEEKRSKQQPDGTGISIATSVEKVLPFIQSLVQAGGKDSGREESEGGGRGRPRRGRPEGRMPPGMEGGMR